MFSKTDIVTVQTENKGDL